MPVLDLQKQYDRFLSQVREEAKDLYWLYNFFFVIESTLLGALLVGKLSETYLTLAEGAGLILAIYWLAIVHKQRLWRNGRIKRIQKIEMMLGYESDLQVWPAKEQKAKLKDYIIGKRGLWRFLFLLPIGFALVWLVLLLS
jgi:hypothetical protein